MNQRPVPGFVLPLIVACQFAGSSVWFAGNGVLSALQQRYALPADSLANITTSVQLGFIIGTLLFAMTRIADRYVPTKVFMLSSILSACCNLSLIWTHGELGLIYTTRFLTGFFLAGVYPVGMKIAAEWFGGNTGKALGYLVGALALGKAIPHLLKGTIGADHWQQVMILTSGMAIAGGITTGIFLRKGPYTSNKDIRRGFGNLGRLFKDAPFKQAAMGYFGHMWELYTLWAFLPMIITTYNQVHHTSYATATWSFIIIALGMPGCIIGGLFSLRLGSKKVASIALMGSAICCLLSPLLFLLPPWLFFLFLIIWGLFVITDSPQFSAMVSGTADPANKGTALALVTSIGFAITIVSIECMDLIWQSIPLPENKGWILPILAIGPVLGLVALRKEHQKPA